MTDPETSSGPEPAALMREVANRAGHELRNALNGLMVNLEVVRGGFFRGGPDAPMTAPFLAQAVSQAEESAQLAEATLALLSLVLGATGDNGEFQCKSISADSIRLASAADEVDRVVQRLGPLSGRAGVQSEADGSAVILTVRSKSYADTD